eukprot:15257498-Alexandrium_andersonii.AAC.1
MVHKQVTQCHASTHRHRRTSAHAHMDTDTPTQTQIQTQACARDTGTSGRLAHARRVSLHVSRHHFRAPERVLALSRGCETEPCLLANSVASAMARWPLACRGTFLL